MMQRRASPLLTSRSPRPRGGRSNAPGGRLRAGVPANFSAVPAVEIRSRPGAHAPHRPFLSELRFPTLSRGGTVDGGQSLASRRFLRMAHPWTPYDRGSSRGTGSRRADGFPGSHGPPTEWRAMVEERLTARHPWTPCDCWDSARHRFWAGGIPGTSWTIESDKAAGNPPGIHRRVAVVGTLRGLDFRRADGVPGSHGPPAEWRAMVEERLTAWHRAGLPRASILEPAPSGGGGCPERARAWQRRLSSVRCGALPRSTGSRR
jgi:hypothetical protein